MHRQVISYLTKTVHAEEMPTTCYNWLSRCVLTARKGLVSLFLDVNLSCKVKHRTICDTQNLVPLLLVLRPVPMVRVRPIVHMDLLASALGQGIAL